MNVFLLLEVTSEYYFGVGVLSFWVLQSCFFCTVRYYSNSQHVNSHIDFISLYPLSYSKKFWFYYIGEFITPNFIAILALGIPFLIYCNCDYTVIIKMLSALILFHVFLSTLSVIIPRNKVTTPIFITVAIVLFIINFQLIMAIAVEPEELESLNSLLRKLFSHYYYLFSLMVALFLSLAYWLREKLFQDVIK